MKDTGADLSILYFGNDWNAENRTSSHHIAERLGARFPLLYLDTPGMRAPQATGRDLRKLVAKVKRTFEPPRKVGPHMWVSTMPQIPFRGVPGISLLNRFISSGLVQRAARHAGFKDPIYWFVVPHASVALGSSKKEFVVYYCIDDYAAFPGVDSASIQRIDDALTARADQLFVASARLFPGKQRLNATAKLSPHGVDVELFGRAMDPDTAVPEAALSLRKPVVGYFGVLGDWIDTELLSYCATQRPQYTFLFIGRVATDAGSLRKLPNTVFVPPQPYGSLPGWAKAFDAAIIPYRLTDQVLNSNPLKLREYLATGKPIASVWAPEIEKFSHCIPLAHNHAEFLALLDAAIKNDSEESRRRRVDAVQEMSWDRRVDEIIEVVRLRRAEVRTGRE